MRISDWSSDVCSSDLLRPQRRHRKADITEILLTLVGGDDDVAILLRRPCCSGRRAARGDGIGILARSHRSGGSGGPRAGTTDLGVGRAGYKQSCERSANVKCRAKSVHAIPPKGERLPVRFSVSVSNYTNPIANIYL